ncbi:hypothetical protein A2U01_0022740, partial [Trifolium medium]|nr:hypothetical protein [Trifolium medium]
MLRKLPRSFHGAKRGKNRRSSSRGGGCRNPASAEPVSDPIQCSDVGVVQTLSMATEPTGCGLEVVLQLQHAEEQKLPSTVLRGSSGLGNLINEGGFIVEECPSDEVNNSQSCDGDPLILREVDEARKLIEIGGELGLKFHDGEGVDIDRMVEMEVRDRAEETKIESMSEILPQCLWGNEDCDWACLPAVGNSGVCLDVIQDQSRVFVVNVYAKCNLP